MDNIKALAQKTPQNKVMYALTEARFQVEVEPILRQVFINDNSYKSPFPFSLVTKERLLTFFYRNLI